MKYVRFIVILILILSLLSACGTRTPTKQDEGPEETADVKTKEETETESIVQTEQTEEIELIVYLESWGQTPSALKRIEAYEEVNPHVTIINEESADYIMKVEVEVTSGETVDLVAVKNPLQLISWLNKGIIIPLDSYAESIGFDYESAYGNLADFIVFDEHNYIIPHNKTEWMLIYNKEIFDEAGIEYPSATEPMTWSQYRSLAAELTDAEGVEKVYGTLHINWPMYWYGQAIQKLGGGEKFYTPEGLSNIEAPEFREALQYAYDMQNVDQSVPKYAQVKLEKLTAKSFFSGQYAMTLSGHWFIGFLKDSERFPREWEAGIAPMPVPDGTDEKITWGVVGGYAIASTSKHPEEALKFLNEFASIDTESIYGLILTSAGKEDVTIPSSVFEGLDTDITEDILKSVLLDPSTKYINEKITGPHADKYDAILKEESEKFFTGEQDADKTIVNIKVRADEILSQEE